MKVDLGIWDRLTKLVLLLIVLAGLVGVVVWYLPLITTTNGCGRKSCSWTR